MIRLRSDSAQPVKYYCDSRSRADKEMSNLSDCFSGKTFTLHLTVTGDNFTQFNFRNWPQSRTILPRQQ